ncbi:MAG: aminoacyl-tRNA deacylase [Chromatiaceae bacterium]|jgi:Cys-tRNA(Pro) deacylase|nr:aminoacyl-tRNA deacylase [Chromatiaceae bacterium]
MGTKKEPVTPAIRALRAAGVAFEGHLYDYQEHGGTAHSARALGVDEHLVIKTLIMEDEAGNPLIVLMHGDREVATGLLARSIGVKRVDPCEPKTAERHSGYQVGGTSPFGTRRAMPVYCEEGVAALPRIYINGGKRGYLVSLATEDALRLLAPRLVCVAR